MTINLVSLVLVFPSYLGRSRLSASGVQGLGFRVWGQGFGVKGLGSRVWGFCLSAALKGIIGTPKHLDFSEAPRNPEL